jgi:phosphopantetheine adenylyltransferase
MQMNHCIVEVFTIVVVLIRNQKTRTNIFADMPLVEMIKEVITDRHGAKATHFVGFVVKATTLHQYVDRVL